MVGLSHGRISNFHYGMVTQSRPWHADIETPDVFQLIVVRQGGCWFYSPDYLPQPVFVAEGALIGTTGRVRQVWRDSWREPVPSSLRGATLKRFPVAPLHHAQAHPWDDRATRLLVGTADLNTNPALLAFPPVFHVPPQDSDAASCLLPMIDAIERESRADGDAPSQEDIVRCATEIVLITLERYVTRRLSPHNVWWGDRDFDPKVMRAIKLIERESTRNWTVESLAAEVGMGRSAFAMRFREMVGDTPVNCLFKTRMRLASVLIREQRSSIAAVAEAAGYQSESAFIKAFVRHFGMTPGQYRTTATDMASAEETGDAPNHWATRFGDMPSSQTVPAARPIGRQPAPYAQAVNPESRGL